ncbi:MAG: pantetheine-phosphate adenylyltransferase [Clostridia bacterium]|nr:pantetheine-phosphate adenylyltransferase [Clostridia bacterium]
MPKAICPGSFDPVTNGHLDVVERASGLFDEVTVVVMSNFRKKGLYTFTAAERADLLRKSTAHLDNVKVDTYDGLLAQYAKEHDITVIVKGLRAVSDFEDEFQQSIANKHMYEKLETVFLPCREQNMFLSSSLVKQMGALGGDITEFVPPEVAEDIITRLRKEADDGTD